MSEEAKKLKENVYSLADRVGVSRADVGVIAKELLGRAAKGADDIERVYEFFRWANDYYDTHRGLAWPETVIKLVPGFLEANTVSVEEMTDDELEAWVNSETGVIEVAPTESAEDVTHTDGPEVEAAEDVEEPGMAALLGSGESKVEVKPERPVKAEKAPKKVLVKVVSAPVEGGLAPEVEAVEPLVSKSAAGTFTYREISEGVYTCENGSSKNVYGVDVNEPSCTCKDFQINRQGSSYCKHLRGAAEIMEVAELPEIPGATQLARRVVREQPESMVSVRILDQDVDLMVQTVREKFESEMVVAERLKTILGEDAQKSDVIESFAGVEEIGADPIISLGQAVGITIAFLPRELETAKIKIGELYAALEDMKGAPKNDYEESKRKAMKFMADKLPEVTVVTRCKMTAVAVWQDKLGNMRLGFGTKDEYLTPPDLKNLVTRGSNFIETKCETKSQRKAILNVLPLTHDGLMRKIKSLYKWQ